MENEAKNRGTFKATDARNNCCSIIVTNLGLLMTEIRKVSMLTQVARDRRCDLSIIYISFI
jgi:hypothetical protein